MVIFNFYVLKQLIILFFLTVTLLSAVGVSLGTLSELAYQMSNYNLPLNAALKIFILKIPEYVAYGLPIGTLITCLIIYGRLNSDRELIALQSFGFSLYRVVIPALGFSLMISLITFFLNEAVTPPANYQVALIQQKFLPETELSLQKKDIFFPEYGANSQESKNLQRLYYAETFDGKKLHNLVIFNWHQSDLQQIIVAKKASWNSQSKQWNMEEGFIKNLASDNNKIARSNFQQKQIKLPATLFKIVTQGRDPYAMSLTQARNYLRLIIPSGDRSKISLFQVRIHQKLAFPSICLIFSLIGSSLGIQFNNLNRGKSFGLGVAIVFSYYLLGFLIGSLGIAGIISPIIAAWLPNFIGLGWGFWLLYSAT